MKNLHIGNLVIPVPIIQGGMGVGISLSRLASAVANQGGVGVMSAAGLGLLYRHLSSDYPEACILGLREEIKKARDKTKGIIGVNIMVAMTNFADMVKTSIAEKVDIIFSGAGLPLDLPSFLQKDSTTKLVPIVSSARAAKLICDKWKAAYNYLPDAVVVEGPKAGGHLGYKESQLSDDAYRLETITPEVVATIKEIETTHDCKISVIAAGGIYTGADMYDIMQLGADGVQLGTRFVTTTECDASEIFKQAYIDATEAVVEIIESPVGRPGRAIFSDFLQKVKDGEKQPKSCPFHCIKTCQIETSPYCIMLALFNAYKGNMTMGYAFAGTNAHLATAIVTVKDTMDAIQEEYKAREKELV